MIKRLLSVFELTVPEQRVVIFALCALVGFVALKTYRDVREDAPLSSALQTPTPTPQVD